MQNYDMEKVLPHKPPMILVDDVLEYNAQECSVISIVRIHENKTFFDKALNGIRTLVGIEFMAQTIGCYAYFKNNVQTPNIGFLLGTRLYNCDLERFENGKTYKVKAKEIFTDSELVSFECFIYNENEVECASAVINAYMPSSETELMGMLNG